MLSWISKPRTISESHPHLSFTAPGKKAQEIINFTTSCKITCFSWPWKAGAGNTVCVLVTAWIFCLLLLLLQMEGKIALSDCHKQRYASNCFLGLASDPEKNNCLRLTWNQNFAEFLVKWNRLYWVKMSDETLALIRGELFCLGGVPSNLTKDGWRGEFYSMASHLAHTGKPELQAVCTQHALGYEMGRTEPYSAKLT